MLLRQVDLDRDARRPARRRDAAHRGRGRPQRRVPHVQQPPRAITADAVLASAAIPDDLPRRAPRRRHVLGRALLAEPARPRAGRHGAGRDLGHPDQRARARDRADHGASRSPTAATSWRATCRCTRSCTSSRRSTSSWRRASSRPAAATSRSWCASSSCRARACRPGSAPRPSSTATRRSSASSSSTARSGRTSSWPRSPSSAPGAPATPSAVLAHFAEDAEVSAPGADGDVAAFVRGRLADGVTVDATRKQVARDGVTGRCASTGAVARPCGAARRAHHPLRRRLGLLGVEVAGDPHDAVRS